MDKSSKPYRILGIISVVILLLPGTPLPIHAATILYENSFDSGLGNITKEWECRSTQYTIGDPDNSGNNAARLEQLGNAGCEEPSGKREIKHRTLMAFIKPDGSKVTLSPNTEYWIGYRVYVPDSYPEKEGTFVGGLIYGAIPGETAFIIRDGDWIFFRRYRDPVTDQLVEKTAYRSQVQRGRWHNFVFNLVRGWKNDGTYKLWVDGKQVTNETRVITATDYASLYPTKSNPYPYLRLGMYWGVEDRSDKHVLYFDDVRIAQGANGFDLVNPSVGPNNPGNVRVAPPTPGGLKLEISNAE